LEIVQSFHAISFKWKSHTHRQTHNYKIQIDENLELVHKANQNMLTNLLWLQSTQMMQWFSPQLKLKQRFWLVFFTQEEDVRTTNHNVIHTYGRGQPRRARGWRPSGPPRWGTATRAIGAALSGGRRRSTPAARWGVWRAVEEEGAEGWRCRRRGRGS